MKNKENLELLAEKIRQVDVVVIGGGSGLSSAAGYNHYHWMPYLEGQLQDFKEAYGFQSPFAGFYYCYSSPEQQWAFYARYIQSLWDAPTGQTYYDLAEIVSGKEVFVLTTNVDMQFERVFPQNSICSYQGMWAIFNAVSPAMTGFIRMRTSSGRCVKICWECGYLRNCFQDAGNVDGLWFRG